MSGISVKTGFPLIGMTFLAESLMLAQESRKVKLITKSKRNWLVQIHCPTAMKYGVKGSISQRLNIPQCKYYWIRCLVFQKRWMSMLQLGFCDHRAHLMKQVKKSFHNLLV